MSESRDSQKWLRGAVRCRRELLCYRSHRNLGSKLICSAIASESVSARSCRWDRCRRISVSLAVLTLRRDWAVLRQQLFLRKM